MEVVNRIRLPVEIWAEILSHECLYCEYWAVIRYVCKDWTAAFRLLEKNEGEFFVYNKKTMVDGVNIIRALEIKLVNLDKTLWGLHWDYDRKKDTTSFIIEKGDFSMDHSICWAGSTRGKIKNNMSEILKHITKRNTHEIDVRIGDLLCTMSISDQNERYSIYRGDEYILYSDGSHTKYITCLEEASAVAPYIPTLFDECINYFFIDTVHLSANIIQYSLNYDKFVLKESSI